MNKDEDEQDDAATIVATRYPVMPSLVALQQMRNRLHLAFVGKKLMKWTAQATGRELRRLAFDAIHSYKSFRDDMRNSFMLLARARYFYPNLNKMVLEHIGHEANIKIQVSTKALTGVKVLHLDIVDNGDDTYQHLGIDKGGQAIMEAKQAWRLLLRRVVLMLEQRICFTEVDLAHKSATKRKNVLAKIIIPKLKLTIKFILSELEEKEREDSFRLKRFKQLKYKNKKSDGHVCYNCLSMIASEEDAVEFICPVCHKPAKAKGKSSEITLNVDPCESAVSQEKENKELLDHLMSHIDDVIDLTRQDIDGILSEGVNKFIKTCSEIREKIEDYANAPPLCDVCKSLIQNSESGVKQDSRSATNSASSKPLNIPCSETTEAPQCTNSCYDIGPETEDKLGFFEKKFEEIVIVTRLQNEDGSVSEEKEVITIKTEIRNPRKTGTLKINDDNCIEPGGKRCSGCRDYGGGTDYGGDGGPDFRPRIRGTKSEYANRSHQMGEPRLRSCISASNPKSSMNKDATTNFDSSANMSVKTSRVTLPSTDIEHKLKRSCGSFNVCCPRKTESVCGSELESEVTSQMSIVSCKSVTQSATSQTCCKEVRVKKPMEDRGFCCLPTCSGGPYDKNNKFQTTSTEAFWRDVWTSTTDLAVEPSRAASSVPSRSNKKQESRNQSPVSSCCSKESNQSDGKKRKKKGGCCTIKIIAKPPKVCIEPKPKEEEKEMKIPGSMFETIKKILLPPTRSTESSKVEPKEPEIKNICKSCLSKLSIFSAKPSFKSQSSSCKMCQASIASKEQEEAKNCPSCGSLAKASSCGSITCKSTGVESGTTVQHAFTKSPIPSLHCQKHCSCLSKSKSRVGSTNEEDETTSCTMARTTKSSKSICCPKKKSSSVCGPALSSKISLKSNTSSKSASASCSRKDASTSTKRSARFDVRPIRRRHTYINLGSCTCKSDLNINRNRAGKCPAKRSKSFYEDEYYYFRW